MKRPSGMTRRRYCRILLGFAICSLGMAIRRVGEWLMEIDDVQAGLKGRPAFTREDFESSDFEKRW